MTTRTGLRRARRTAAVSGVPAVSARELVVTSQYLGSLCTRQIGGDRYRIVGVHLEPPGVSAPVAEWLDLADGTTRLVWIPWLGWCARSGSAARYPSGSIDAPRLVTLDGQPALRLPTSNGSMRLMLGRTYEVRPDGTWGWSLWAMT
ncbi:hypothetical protein AB0M43_34735 [Longispora sp. NPDC051575]|uniref:hypothetical protein n=1 Tax=Longispora sp. NPDC051575 TaxID=3154943 RepID=UPI0034329BBD